MPYISTDLLNAARPGLGQGLSPGEIHQTYCGLDCAVTWEVHAELNRLFNQPPAIYSFERALQGPYLEIMQRGFRVDQFARSEGCRDLTGRIAALQETLNEFAQACWGRPLNPRSPDQLKKFFYSELGLPEVRISQKGERKVSTNREALEKLEESYLHARPIISCILAIRDLGKQLSVLDTEIDSDGRFRTSYNIAGTETGRPSSSSNAFGTGGNTQNIAPSLRYIFVADPGWKLCVIDLEQVEARDVGWFCGVLFGDWRYLNACEAGDLHTANAKLTWKELPWTGEAKADRKLAERPFYREFSYRDMAKRGGHLSNYMGTAWTMARVLKIPQAIADEFQQRYCRGKRDETAYPCISDYWGWIAEQLQTTNCLTTPFGRERHFFGRPGDDTTLREAIAFLPQSTTADRMNLGLWRVWKHMPQIQLLAQTFDSITFQYREGDDGVIPEALARIKVELRAPNGRSYVVPGEAKIGWNWGGAVTARNQKDEEEVRQARGLSSKKPKRLNPDGLIKWRPGSPDLRSRSTGLLGITG